MLGFHAGSFRDRITIQTRTKTRTGTGVTEVWTDVETRWARVIPLNFESRVRYGQTFPEASYTIVFREEVSLNAGDYRMKWTGKNRILVPRGPEWDPEGTPGSFTVVLVSDRPDERDD